MTLDRATTGQRQMLNAYLQAGSIKAGAELLGIKEQTGRHRLMALYKRCQIQNVAQAAYLLGREHRPQ